MTEPTRSSARLSSASAVSWPVRVAASWSWRLLLVGALVVGLFQLLGLLYLVVVPIGIALLASALLTPAVAFLARHRVPRGLAVAVVMIGGLALIVSVLTFVVRARSEERRGGKECLL